ncbi:ABC transporter ATP-binding protein [Sulfuriferula sp. GW1]|uniref:ABC transporter ATP-binding protein n=1 Tax=Sulfuriferula sp. GW1 TaxID=3345111 RepID=UPI0039AFD848
MSIIEVNHVTKEYQLGQLHSLKTTALNQWRRLTGQPMEVRAPFKALDDVNFSIEQGEVVGIIGHNGAGKSTMLKLLANISKPSSGSVIVKGKVAPLIEVGAGLVGDLTGRENIYLNGAILGISKAEINRKFDDIVAFAELEEFIDTPIKRYSSGMQVRLGFSIATSVESDILIVDEVLAVGDLAFQRKCFDRMEDLIKRQGKTVLLVSHNIRQVERLCTRCILLSNGKIITDGQPGKVCDLYYQNSNDKVHHYALEKQRLAAAIYNATDDFKLLGIEILDANGCPTETLGSGEPLRIRVRFQLDRFVKKPEIVVGTHTTDFVYLTAASTADFEDRPDYMPGEHEIEYLVDSFPLVGGTYCIRLIFFDEFARPLFQGETLKMFSVREGKGDRHESGWLTLKIPTKWRLQGRSYENDLLPESVADIGP